MLAIALPVRLPLPRLTIGFTEFMRAIMTMLEFAASFVLRLASSAAVKNDSALTHWGFLFLLAIPAVFHWGT